MPHGRKELLGPAQGFAVDDPHEHVTATFQVMLPLLLFGQRLDPVVLAQPVSLDEEPEGAFWFIRQIEPKVCAVGAPALTDKWDLERGGWKSRFDDPPADHTLEGTFRQRTHVPEGAGHVTYAVRSSHEGQPGAELTLDLVGPHALSDGMASGRVECDEREWQCLTPREVDRCAKGIRSAYPLWAHDGVVWRDRPTSGSDVVAPATHATRTL